MDRRSLREQYMQRGYGDRGAQQQRAYGDPRQIMRDRLSRQQGGMDPRGQREMEQQDGMRGGYGGGLRRRLQEQQQGYDMDPQEREMMRQQRILQAQNMRGGGGYDHGQGGFDPRGGVDNRERRMARDLRREQEQMGRHNGGYEGGDDMSREELRQQRRQQRMDGGGGRPQREFRDPREDGPSWTLGGHFGYGRRR